MAKIRRFSASLEPEILKKLDSFQNARGIETRSEALRVLIRDNILAEGWNGKGKAYGVITLLYDHHGRETLKQLTDIQHDADINVIVSQHIHISHHMCLEIITAEGTPRELESFAARLSNVHGVKRSSLSRAAVEEDFNI